MRTIRELAGWGLLLVVQITPLAALGMLVAFAGGAPAPELLGGALLAMLIWPRLWLSARRLREPPEEEVAEADGRPPVVIFHRFARVAEPLAARFFASPALIRELRDERLERRLSARAVAAGPVLTLARPAPPPTHGPMRTAIEPEWAREVDRRLRRAAIAILVADGSEASAYEIERSRALLGLERTAIVLPPGLSATQYQAMRSRFPFLPAVGDRVVRFDAAERAVSMPALLLRDTELAPRPSAPIATMALPVLAILAGVVSAIATPLALADRLDLGSDEPLIAGGATVLVLAIVLAVLSRRALRLVAANEVVMVTVAASPWLAAATLAATVDERVEHALSLDVLSAAYSAPLLAVTALILAVAALVRRSPGRRAAFATFGAAALLPFVPLASGLGDAGAGSSAFEAMLVVSAIGLGLAAWGASGEPQRANAPLPIGAAIAAVLAAVAGGVVAEHLAWRDLLGRTGAQLELVAPMARELTTFAQAWPLFALAGPVVVVLIASRFAGRASRASIGSLAAFAPLVIVASLVVTLEGRAREELDDPNRGYPAAIFALEGGTSLAPGFTLPVGTTGTPWASGGAQVVIDRVGVIASGVRVSGELRGSSPALARALARESSAGGPLRIAAARDVPITELLRVVRTARRLGWESIALFALAPIGYPGAIEVSIVGWPSTGLPFTVHVRADAVLVTDSTGALVSIPDASGGIDEAALRLRLEERRRMAPNGQRAVVLVEDGAGETARLVHTLAVVRAYVPFVELGGI